MAKDETHPNCTETFKIVGERLTGYDKRLAELEVNRIPELREMLQSHLDCHLTHARVEEVQDGVDDVGKKLVHSNSIIDGLHYRLARIEKAMPCPECGVRHTKLTDIDPAPTPPSVREIAERCHGDLKNLSCICTENTRCEDCEEETTRIAQAIEEGVAEAEITVKGCRKALGDNYNELVITDAIRQCRQDRDRLQADLLTIKAVSQQWCNKYETAKADLDAAKAERDVFKRQKREWHEDARKNRAEVARLEKEIDGLAQYLMAHGLAPKGDESACEGAVRVIRTRLRAERQEVSPVPSRLSVEEIEGIIIKRCSNENVWLSPRVAAKAIHEMLLAGKEDGDAKS